MSEQQDFAHRVKDCVGRMGSSGTDALGALFDLTSQRLVRYAIALTRCQHDAEDAVQAALVRVASRPNLLNDIAFPWAYLLRMVRNEALTIDRRNNRCAVAGDLSDLVTQCSVDEMEQEETYRQVWSALRSLPPAQAEVVVLKIWEQMTFAEIARVLDASPNTVASRYQYALNKLSVRLTKKHREVQRG